MATPALLRVGVVGVVDFVRFSVLVFKGDPMFLLAVRFLDRYDVVVVNEFSGSFFLSFPAVLGGAFGGEKAVGITGGK